MRKGDKISVLDENLKGVIVALQDTMVTFEDEYGFIYEYPIEKLVLQNGNIYNDIQVEKKFEHLPILSKKHQKQHLVLDLHFEKLVSNTSKYDSFERLFIQKEKLLEALEFCRNNNLKKLEIIHGIGDGTLQNMVYETLRNKGDIEFEDYDFFYHQSGAVVVEFQ